MVKFIDVNPEDIPNLMQGRRGKVSYPILKSFLETNKLAAMLDRKGMDRPTQGLTMALNSYIRTHELPIRLVQRNGEIYLLRTDIDDNGELINTGFQIGVDKAESNEQEDESEIEDVTDEAVDANYR